MKKYLGSVQIQWAAEQLRQESEVFDQRKQHEARWFRLRLVMGYSSIVLLTFVMWAASYVLFNADKFTAGTVTLAGAALFADVLGLLVGVWKIALNPSFMAQVAPVTTTVEKEPSGPIG